jgi:hypothetical protein
VPADLEDPSGFPPGHHSHPGRHRGVEDHDGDAKHDEDHRFTIEPGASLAVDLPQRALVPEAAMRRGSEADRIAAEADVTQCDGRLEA